MKKNTCVKQQDITDCGAACLASVAAWYGRQMSIARIRQLANTDKQGTTMLGMLEAAEKIGFSAKGVKGNFQSLFEIPLPSIVHVITEEKYHHYKVLCTVTQKFFKVMDPSDGKWHKLKPEDFRKEWSGVMLLMTPSDAFCPGKLQGSLIHRFFYLLRPHKSVLIQSLTGAVIYALLGLTTSVYVQKIVDHVLVDGNLNLLNLMSVFMLIFLAMKICINIMKGLFTLKTGQQIDAMLIMGYFRHILCLPRRFFDTMRIGEILSRMNDAVRIRSLINNASLEIAVNLMIVVFTFLLMFMLAWKMALIVLCVIPLFLLVWVFYNQINKRILRKIMENSAELESHLVESLDTISTIKQFSANNFVNQKTESRFFKFLKSIYISSRSMIMVQGASEFFAGILTIVVLWIGSYQVIHNIFTAGTLLSFYAMLGYLTGPLVYLINANHIIQDAFIAADRLFQILDLECEQDGECKVILTPEMIGDIHFRHVNFRYSCRSLIFEDLNMLIRKGDITAIVGESGSGKTSIISLIENLYPVQSGNIEIGNYSLQQIDIESLRKYIGIVPQKIELVSATIAENIAFGEPEPDIRRIIDICGLLNMRDFIEKIPGAYHAMLGEHGVSLSGGEQQRLAIARSIYKDPEILVFDEATSALDALAEATIRQVIRMMKGRGKTVIMISHRFRSIMYADKIFVMHKGKLMEEGNHSALMSARGYYFNLWKQQFPMLEQVVE